MIKVDSKDSKYREPHGLTPLTAAIFTVILTAGMIFMLALYYRHVETKIKGTAQDLFYAGTNYYLDKTIENQPLEGGKQHDGYYSITDLAVLGGYYSKPLNGEMILYISESKKKLMKAEYQENFFGRTIKAVYPTE